VNQLRGAQSMIGRFARQLSARQFLKLLIHDGDELIDGVAVSSLPGPE